MKQKWICLLFILIRVNGFPVLYSQTSMAETAFDYGKKLYGEKFYDLSILQFKNFLEQYPDSPDAGGAWYYLGESQLSLKHYHEAQKAFLNLVLLFPNHHECPAAYFKIAECFQKMNKPEEAVTSFKRVYEYFPNHTMGQEGLYQAAELALKSGHFQHAHSILQRLQTQQLTYDLRSRSQFLLSKIYMKQNQYEAALDILNPIRKTGIREEDQQLAGFEMASIFLRMGWFEQSKDLYKELVQEIKNDSLLQQAYYQIGLISYRLNELQSAKRNLLRAIEIAPSSSQSSTTFFYLAMIARQEEQFQDGINFLEKAIEKSNSLQDRRDYCVEIAKLFLKKGDFFSAEESLNSILQDASDDNHRYIETLLLMAKSLYLQNEYEKSFQYYQELIRIDPSNPIIPYILIRKSKNYLKRGIIRQGWSLLRDTWEQYPVSECAPLAHYIYAQSLEANGSRSEAFRIYQLITEEYSGSIYADSAQFRMDCGDSKPAIFNTQELIQLQSLVHQGMNQPDNCDLNIQYAVFLVERMHLDEQALLLLKECLNSESHVIKAKYYSGLAYSNLYHHNRYQADKDSSAWYFEEIIRLYPSSPYAIEATRQYAILMKEPKSKIIQKYKHLVSHVSDSLRKCKIYQNIGVYYLNTDSLDQAKAYFQLCAKKAPKSYRGMGQYYMACVYQRMGKNQVSDSLFQSLEKQYPDHPKMHHILYQRGCTAKSGKETDTAIAYFQRVRNDYPYTSLADSAHFNLGQLWLNQKQYKQAVRIFAEIIQKDSMKSSAYEAGLIDEHPVQHPDVISGLAKAYEGLGEYAKSWHLYFKYHDLYSVDQKDVFYINLARISEKQKHYNRAIQYTLLVLEKNPSDCLYEKLGSLYEKSQEYDQAYNAYQRALKMSTKMPVEADLNQKLILCLLKQDKLPEADVRINVFEKSFKRQDSFDTLLAEIYLEKGKAQFRQKNFKQAEDLFDRVRDKFKKTHFRIDAELELGRTLIYTNRIEDALNLLTHMLDKYQDDPVYYQVYLNLGDLYFRNQQFENALMAFKNAQSDSAHPENQQLASRYIIRIYETMGLWEAALTITRDYIRYYSNADDILQKKVKIGNFYMRLKDYYRAIDQFKKVQLEADAETDAEIQYWIGKCYAEMGQFDRAILEYLKVKYISKPTKLPWGSTAMYEAAMTYLKLYQPWQARVIFEKIVQYEGVTSDLGRIARQRIDEIDQGKYAEMN